MATRRDRPRLRTDLRTMLFDGVAFSVMVGIGESYVAPFVLALGKGDVAAGLITTLPMLLGSILQLVSPAAVKALGSHKRWVTLCAALQAMTFVPLVVGALSGELSSLPLYLAVTLYWGLGLATGPAWNTWAGTLIPERLRARYLAGRARWTQTALLLGLALGGTILHVGAAWESPLHAYALVFAVAMGARLLSATALGRQSEPKPVPLGETSISPSAIRTHVAAGGHGRLLLYLLAYQGGVWIAAPYFTPFMLGPLGLDYVTFGLLTGAAFAARIVVSPALGRYAHRSGTRRLLRIASVAIVPLPVMWLVSDWLPWLLALQLAGGAAWAAFELASLLTFFEHIPAHGRTSVLSVYNVAHASAVVVGSTIGALILAGFGRELGGYAVLFAASSATRLASLLLVGGLPDVVPEEDEPPPLRTLGLRPTAGALQKPILPGPEMEEAEAES